MQLRGRHFENGEPVCVTIRGDRIWAVEPAFPTSVADWPWIAPALFDLQINGHGGVWFSKQGLTADDVLRILEPHFQYGITRLMPTLITNSQTALQSGFTAIREACDTHPWVDQMVPGCHLEGPYISREDGPRGAHPIEHVRRADWDEFQELQDAAGGRIRLVTLAPECDGAIDFIQTAVQHDVVIAIGHTGADPDQIDAAIDAGARLSTHLGNGAHGTLRRHPNYIWQQLGDPRLMASLITDGHHIPDSVIRTFVATKTPFRSIITCDAAGLAGCPPGIYHEDSGDVEILEDGRIVIAGQRQFLAGSSVETDTCIGRAVRSGAVTLKQALEMAGRNPARLLGFEEFRLRRGSRADLIAYHFDELDSSLNISATMTSGTVRHGAFPEPE